MSYPSQPAPPPAEPNTLTVPTVLKTHETKSANNSETFAADGNIDSNASNGGYHELFLAARRADTKERHRWKYSLDYNSKPVDGFRLRAPPA